MGETWLVPVLKASLPANFSRCVIEPNAELRLVLSHELRLLSAFKQSWRRGRGLETRLTVFNVLTSCISHRRSPSSLRILPFTWPQWRQQWDSAVNPASTSSVKLAPMLFCNSVHAYARYYGKRVALLSKVKKRSSGERDKNLIHSFSQSVCQ